MNCSVGQLYQTLCLSVCKNFEGDLFNIWGLTNCTEESECREGYEGNNCNKCSSFHYPINGNNITVDSNNGEGVICQSIYHQI